MANPRSRIGRATLYKYFPDVESILVTWHQRRVNAHLQQLTEARDQAGTPDERLEAVLHACALITFERAAHERPAEFAALVHRDEHLAHAQQHLHGLVRDLIADAAKAGGIRDDIDPDELASYCLYALTAAGDLPSKDAVHRLVTVTLTGLRPTSTRPDPTGDVQAHHTSRVTGSPSAERRHGPRHGHQPTDS
ncbi:TetR/AcrR family transcriptional regulator [Streptomyces sp. NBC_01136]|uniref:TetR/AcrR family transcriptional regulator n=1 Tax=unclassified Streptomyces TaxID=2593676 RepID=UPI003253BD56|nr:TetR/AcrR family transcriptional regulator [Streptomyces sp. NBC_01136]